MARRKRRSKPPSKRRLSASQIAFYALSLIIVLSMAVGFVISVLPTPTRSQQTVVTPTPVILITSTPTPTQEPTITPTPATEELPASDVATPQSD